MTPGYRVGVRCANIAGMGSDPESEYLRKREEMVVTQLEARGIADSHLLEVMRRVPRHMFVPDKFRGQAYSDKPIVLGEGSTIYQPYIAAYMAENLNLGPNEKVLEVGTGSGYLTAILAELAGTVYSMEVEPDLSQRAMKLLGELGYRNVYTRVGNGLEGWKGRGPFDAIIVSAAIDGVPRELVKQLADDGRMIFPIEGDPQYLILLEKKDGEILTHELCSVTFEPAKSSATGSSH